MPKKETPLMLLEKHLGKTAAKALFGKIDKMIEESQSPAKIEKLVHEEVAAHYKKQLEKSVKLLIDQKKKVPTKKPVAKPAPPVRTGPQPPLRVKTGVKPPLNVKTGPGPKKK